MKKSILILALLLGACATSDSTNYSRALSKQPHLKGKEARLVVYELCGSEDENLRIGADNKPLGFITQGQFVIGHALAGNRTITASNKESETDIGIDLSAKKTTYLKITYNRMVLKVIVRPQFNLVSEEMALRDLSSACYKEGSVHG